MQQASTATEASSLGLCHKFSVYIEDTDCYGVVYNCNYLKFFDRARQTALGLLPLKDLRRKQIDLVTSCVRELRLPGAAVLGQELRIESRIVSADRQGGMRWDQSLLCEETNAVIARMEARTKFVHESSTGREEILQALSERSQVCSLLEEGVEDGREEEERAFVMEGRMHEERTDVFADDFDARKRISDLR
eukprot:766348-Hanusia_phi.AAC.4